MYMLGVEGAHVSTKSSQISNTSNRNSAVCGQEVHGLYHRTSKVLCAFKSVTRHCHRATGRHVGW